MHKLGNSSINQKPSPSQSHYIIYQLASNYLLYFIKAMTKSWTNFAVLNLNKNNTKEISLIFFFLAQSQLKILIKKHLSILE